MHSASLLIALTLIAAPLAAQDPKSSFVPGTAADEVAIRAIMANIAADKPDAHQAADLDWENAFGIRYFDLKKRDAFYGAVVTPQFKTATNETLEVKVRFIEPTLAVADEYWHVAGQVYAGETKPGPDRWGRTTYIFKKVAGEWTEVLERVADLRVPYYKHYDALPTAVPVPAATLASYAGTYKPPSGAAAATLTAEGDHLVAKLKRGTYVAIPTTATEFLAFDPSDLAEYYKISFGKDATGKPNFTFSYATGEIIGVLTKAP